MAFSEETKLEVKRKSAFRCCRCHEIGIDVHHILPQYQGGTDDFDNAAPLCQNCHDRFGDSEVKRKEIRQMRDWWYGVVAERFASSDQFKVHISQLGADIRLYLEENRKLLRNLVKPKQIRKRSGTSRAASSRPKGKTRAARKSPQLIFDPKYVKKYITVDDIKDESAFALEVKGESMLPRFRTGDIVIISPGAKVQDGDVCAIRVKDDDTLKVVKFDGELVHLIPLNPEFEPLSVKKSDIHFIWKVVKLISSM
jgi:SOS-response transcriptional repressor LexA